MNKKRKVEEGASRPQSQQGQRPEIKKPRDAKDPASRPGSSQSNYGAPASNYSINNPQRPPTSTSHYAGASSSHLKSSTHSNSASNPLASSSSAMVGVKYMSDQLRLTNGNGAPTRVSNFSNSTNAMKSSMKKAAAPAPVVVEQDEYVELPDIDSE